MEEEGVGQPSSSPSNVAVAFVPPACRARGSITSSEEGGSLAPYSDDEDDGLPYPGFLPITWGCLYQTTAPRNYCLAMITNPYPFTLSVLLCSPVGHTYCPS